MIVRRLKCVNLLCKKLLKFQVEYRWQVVWMQSLELLEYARH